MDSKYEVVEINPDPEFKAEAEYTLVQINLKHEDLCECNRRDGY